MMNQIDTMLLVNRGGRQTFGAAYIAWDEIKMPREETIENLVSYYNGEMFGTR